MDYVVTPQLEILSSDWFRAGHTEGIIFNCCPVKILKRATVNFCDVMSIVMSSGIVTPSSSDDVIKSLLVYL